MRYEHGRYIANRVPHTTQVSNAVSPRIHDIKLLSSHHRNARARALRWWLESSFISWMRGLTAFETWVVWGTRLAI